MLFYSLESGRYPRNDVDAQRKRVDLMRPSIHRHSPSESKANSMSAVWLKSIKPKDGTEWQTLPHIICQVQTDSHVNAVSDGVLHKRVVRGSII